MRVVLADDHAIFRASLRAILEREANVEVVAEAADGREAIDLVQRLSPEIVILDIGMPGLNGVETALRITRRFRKTKIIALSVHTQRTFVERMLEAGASAYLAKECSTQELRSAIRKVRADGIYLCPRVVGHSRTAVRHVKGKLHGGISAREREVLQLLAEGHGNKEIAYMLGTSVKTVETQRRHVMERLGLDNIPALTKYAIREGLTALDTDD